MLRWVMLVHACNAMTNALGWRVRLGSVLFPAHPNEPLTRTMYMDEMPATGVYIPEPFD